MKKNGDVNTIIVLDNYLAQKMGISNLFPCLTIKFLPTNATNKNQPDNMEMLAALKVGYKSLLLQTLLETFNKPGGYKEAARIWSIQLPVMKGIKYGGKPHILYFMKMLKKYGTRKFLMKAYSYS